MACEVQRDISRPSYFGSLAERQSRTPLVGVMANMKGCQISIALNNRCVCSGLIATGWKTVLHSKSGLFFSLALFLRISSLSFSWITNSQEWHCTHTHIHKHAHTVMCYMFFPSSFVQAEIQGPRIITKYLLKQLSLYK